MGILQDAHGSEPKYCCAIYARTATMKQAGDSNSIEVQLEAARMYAGERGWAIFDEYADEGVSGLSDKGRVRFPAMIGEALTPDPPFSIILVSDLSRFYRDHWKLQATLAALRANGVQVQSITQPLQDNSGHSLFETMRAYFLAISDATADDPVE